MSDLLFDVQWWIPGLIALIGLAAFLTGNRNLKKGRERAGLVLLAIALVWGLMSYFVETDKEKVLKESHRAAQIGGGWRLDAIQIRVGP